MYVLTLVILLTGCLWGMVSNQLTASQEMIAALFTKKYYKTYFLIGSDHVLINAIEKPDSLP